MDADVFNSVVAEFIHNLGVDPTAYHGSRVISLTLDKSGQYFIELCEDGVIVYLSRQYQELSSSNLISLLQACDHRFSGQNCLYGGLSEENNLMCIAHIEERNVTAQSLFSELNKLCNMHDSIEEGVHV